MRDRTERAMATEDWCWVQRRAIHPRQWAAFNVGDFIFWALSEAPAGLTPYQLSILWREGGRKGNYDMMRRYIWCAKQLSLVEVLRTEKGKPHLPKNYYRITAEGRRSGLWPWLQGFVYPETLLGGKHGEHYDRWKTLGSPKSRLLEIKLTVKNAADTIVRQGGEAARVRTLLGRA